ncbi:hypothetical protein QBC38DRAFT_285757 [Podospora fimiseda]|uniref:G-protein coupled receptors family 2 profile 2 domain-containing protein n=1 Tax=Podospora fimiseda TaxID=252190 RepID=A0AAN7GY00_9PEZI|nr:hypothetical protein QBC38DRAFT_285757 [Podospora fimiseda]
MLSLHHILGRGEVALTDGQRKTLEIITRFASALSGLGVIVIITTFCISRHFRNPMHRLIFINAFYNAFDVICTGTSISGYRWGNSSALCQFQGFLNQMFPVADVAWTLAMAVNVFLIVFRNYEAQALKRLEWKYALGITLFTFIPAFVFLFIHTEEKGPFYGGVTLWCAIAPKWVLFRIVAYYVPIWSMILVTMILYLAVGVQIVKRRRAFASITTDSIPLDDTVLPETSNRYSIRAGIHVTTTHGTSTPPDTDVGIGKQEESGIPRTPSTISKPTLGTSTCCRSSTGRQSISTQPLTTGINPAQRRSSLSFRQYILMPLFFFLALLSVWVAPSTNRVATFMDPKFKSYPLLLAVGASGSLRGFWNGLVFLTLGMNSRKRSKMAMDLGTGDVDPHLGTGARSTRTVARADSLSDGTNV